jgi:hypothetical protein
MGRWLWRDITIPASGRARFCASEVKKRQVSQLGVDRRSLVERFYRCIRQAYLTSAGDSTALFQTVLSVADEVGLEAALSLLERCVSAKRLAWLKDHLPQFVRTGHALRDGYRLFYTEYLGLSVPEGGEIVAQTEREIIMRWWNPCPTLEACVRLGLDTRVICRRAYHRPVQELLAHLDPRLRFERNYEALRPYAPYCEERIVLYDRS